MKAKRNKLMRAANKAFLAFCKPRNVNAENKGRYSVVKFRRPFSMFSLSLKDFSF